MTISGQAGTDVSLDKTSLTFTTTNWAAGQTVTVTAAQDTDAVDDEVTLTQTTTSTDTDYAGLALGMPVTVNDDDTPVVLVSNSGQSGNQSATYGSDHGQAFTTGNSSNGYIFSSVTIISEDPEADPIALEICEVDGGGAPIEPCTVLTPPGSFARGPLVFTVPDGSTLTLAPGTTHMVVFKTPGCRDCARGRHQQRRRGLRLPPRLVDSKQIPMEQHNRLAKRLRRPCDSHHHQRHSHRRGGGDGGACGSAGRRGRYGHLHGGVGDGTDSGCDGDGVGAGGNGRVVVGVDEQRVDVHHRQLGHIADGDGDRCS